MSVNIQEAINHMKHKDYIKAYNIANEILATDVSCTNSMNILSSIACNNSDFDTALKWMKKAIELSPTSYIYHNNLANIYNKLNDFENAELYYKKSFTINNKYIEGQNNLASLYYRLGKFNEAINIYYKVLLIRPDCGHVHYNLGLIFIKQKKYTFAIKQFNNVISIAPNFIQARHQIGNLHLLQGNYKEAMQHYLYIIEDFPDHLDTLNNLGVVSIKLQQNQEAINYFTKVISLDENNLDALNNIAGVFLNNYLYENALKYYKKLIKIDSNSSEYWQNLGICFMSLGKLDEALSSLQHVLLLDNVNKDALLNISIIYIRNKEYDMAKNTLNKVLSLQQDNQYASYLLSSLNGNIPDRAPNEYVRHLFDNYALYYEAQMLNILHYSMPNIINEFFNKNNLHSFESILELGCGTGLCGGALSSFTNHLVGIDISKQMIKEAEKKNIYHKLICDEITTRLIHQSLPKFSMIAAFDVFNYFGKLDYIFKTCHSKLDDGGLLIFSIEKNHNKPICLQKNARFSHSIEYINTITSSLWENIDTYSVSARKQDDKPVDMYVIILKKISII